MMDGGGGADDSLLYSALAPHREVPSKCCGWTTEDVKISSIYLFRSMFHRWQR